jgi:hypothetical protein
LSSDSKLVSNSNFTENLVFSMQTAIGTGHMSAAAATFVGGCDCQEAGHSGPSSITATQRVGIRKNAKNASRLFPPHLSDESLPGDDISLDAQRALLVPAMVSLRKIAVSMERHCWQSHCSP